MYLAEMGPNTRITNATELGTRDMDRNHDWVNDAQLNYSENDIANVREFLQRVSTNDEEGRGQDDDVNVDPQKLNENQRRVFKRIETHYQNVLLGNRVEPLRIIVMGTAGTGKSYLIKSIRKRLNTMARNGSNTPVQVIAPTGVAAFNINGSTIHSLLSVPINNKSGIELEGNRLKQLQERLQNIIYLIIDEKSMVGRRMLAVIDMRLRQAFPENKNTALVWRTINITIWRLWANPASPRFSHVCTE